MSWTSTTRDHSPRGNLRSSPEHPLRDRLGQAHRPTNTLLAVHTSAVEDVASCSGKEKSLRQQLSVQESNSRAPQQAFYPPQLVPASSPISHTPPLASPPLASPSGLLLPELPTLPAARTPRLPLPAPPPFAT